MSISNLSPKDFFMENTKNKSLCAKLKYALSNITVEPIVFFFVIATLMGMITNQNLALEKSCRVNLRFNETICNAITARNKSGYTISQEGEVQALVQKWEGYKSILMGSVPVVLVVFLGTWSDRNGRRKPLMMLPLIGLALSNILLLLCSIYFMELKMQYSWMSDIIPTSFTGSLIVLLLGIFSYVGGIGDDESKTMRIGTVSMAQTIAMSVGMFLSGIVFHYVGFLGVYTIISSIMIALFFYCLCVVKEQEIITTKKEETKESIMEIFALKHIKNTFKTCFNNGDTTRRKKMIVLMILSTLSIGPLMGELPIIYLSVRLRFGWDEVNYSFYSSCQFIIQIIGNTFALTVLSKYLKLRDVTLGIIAMCSKITAVVIYAFAPTGFFFYVGALAEIFNGTNNIALRAMMSKIVPPHELGQSNSVFGICEGVTPLVFGPIYSLLYIKTLMVFPGAFHLASGGSYVIVMAIYIWFYKETKNEKKIKLEDQEKIEVVKELLQKNSPVDNSKETIKV